MGDLDTTEHKQPPAADGERQTDALRPRGRRKSGRREARWGEPPDDRRPPRPRSERTVAAGFGDGIERCLCGRYLHLLPPAYPVQHRTGLAIMPPNVVARRYDAILLCDGQHAGEHIWPNGDIASAVTADTVPDSDQFGLAQQPEGETD